MNEAQLKQILPRASQDLIELNKDNGSPSSTIVEYGSSPRPLAKKKAQDQDSGKHVVRVTSYRVKLCDEDNLCEKYHVDACRYAGIIPSDAPDKAHIIVTQKKVEKKNQEKTLIEITRE